MTTFEIPETPVPIPTPAGGRIFTKDQVDGHGKFCTSYALMYARKRIRSIEMPDGEDNFEAGVMYALDAIHAMIKEIESEITKD
jgi:hypothetical protein